MKKTYHLPEELYYDPGNQLWLRPGPQGVQVGLNALGLETLGELAYLTLNAVGTHVEKGQPMGALEAAKMTGELIAPVSGTLKAVNNAAVQNPGIVNNDLYNAGWMVVIEPDNWEKDAAEMISGAEVKPWAEREIRRMETQGFDA